VLLSLCIPTNGVLEWVIPVLDSIFSQDVDKKNYEVIVTDNGTNAAFQSKMLEYSAIYSNLVYKKTEAIQFLNQIESFKLAQGEFIKFVNHRMIMRPGALQHLIAFVETNMIDRPAVFFANGVLKTSDVIQQLPAFDSFVKGLSYWSSWSAGLGCWKNDFLNIPEDIEYNNLFPHATILFYERKKEKYIIDDTNLFTEIPVGNQAKGKYNLFYAFSVEYLALLMDLLRTGDITENTFLFVKEQNFKFLAELYADYILLHKKCSYDLSNHQKYLDIFYSHTKLKHSAFANIGKRFFKKLILRFGVLS
jgi:hypothetical protein